VRDWRSTQFTSLYMLTALTMLVGFATVYSIFQYNQIDSLLWPIMAVVFTFAIIFVIVKYVAKESFK